MLVQLSSHLNLLFDVTVFSCTVLELWRPLLISSFLLRLISLKSEDELAKGSKRNSS